MTFKDLATAASIFGLACSLVGTTYVTRERVDANAVRLTNLEASVEAKSTSASATAAGSQLIGRLDGMNDRLSRLEQQNKEILELLRRGRHR